MIRNQLYIYLFALSCKLIGVFIVLQVMFSAAFYISIFFTTFYNMHFLSNVFVFDIQYLKEQLSRDHILEIVVM